MDREVVHALFRLLGQNIKEQLDVEAFWPSTDTLQRLIDGNRAHGYRTISNDPLSGFTNSVTGRQVHQGVCAPLDGPPHLLDLFLDGGGDRAVADVGVAVGSGESVNVEAADVMIPGDDPRTFA